MTPSGTVARTFSSKETLSCARKRKAARARALIVVPPFGPPYQEASSIDLHPSGIKNDEARLLPDELDEIGKLLGVDRLLESFGHQRQGRPHHLVDVHL